jgi:two-component system, OmpR family, phosphate regulon response regulator PhoB
VLSEPIGLTGIEHELLVFLAKVRGRSYTHEQLLNAVWDSSSDWQGASTVSDRVYRLRRKLGLGDARRRIATVRGVGY